MWTKTKSLTLSLWVVRIFMVVLVAAVFFLPSLLEFSVRPDSMLGPLLMALYSSAIPAGIILWFLNKLLSNIRRDDVFIEGNVHCLRVISWSCFAVGVIYLILGISFPFSLLIGIAATFIWLILRVLKNVFAQAVVIKAENDYTI